MARALITVDSVAGSALDATIDTQLQLSNSNEGGESTYAWEILSQPSGTADALSATGIQSPTFRPKKEGGYLIEIKVNGGGSATLVNRIVVRVRHMKSRLMSVAKGETLESGASGWSDETHETIRLLDEIRGDPGICICVAGENLSTVGQVVRFSTLATIKTGLPGEEKLPKAYSAPASSQANVEGMLGLFLGTPAGGATATTGQLVKVRLFGYQTVAITPVPAVNAPIYVSTAGLMAAAPGTVLRQIGRVFDADGSTMTVFFDGTQGGFFGTYSQTLATTNATPTAIWSWPLPANTAFTITAQVVGRRSSGGEARAVFHLAWDVYRVAGDAVIDGDTYVWRPNKDSGATGWSISVDVSGSSVRLLVTGAVMNINWTAKIDLAFAT